MKEEDFAKLEGNDIMMVRWMCNMTHGHMDLLQLGKEVYGDCSGRT